MLTLINTNRMVPAIGPLGLDYVAGSAKQAGLNVEVLDLCFEDDPVASMNRYFRDRSPELVGLTFRNVDDCFWPSADWFVPGLKDTVETIRSMTDARNDPLPNVPAQVEDHVADTVALWIWPPPQFIFGQEGDGSLDLRKEVLNQESFRLSDELFANRYLFHGCKPSRRVQV